MTEIGWYLLSNFLFLFILGQNLKDLATDFNRIMNLIDYLLVLGHPAQDSN